MDGHSDAFPTPQAGLDLFKDEWASLVPSFGLGETPLFADERIRWLESQLGGFTGKDEQIYVLITAGLSSNETV